MCQGNAEIVSFINFLISHVSRRSLGEARNAADGTPKPDISDDVDTCSLPEQVGTPCIGFNYRVLGR